MSRKRYKIDWFLSGIQKAYPNTTHSDRMRFLNAFLEFKILHPKWVVGPDCGMPATRDFLNASTGLMESLGGFEPPEAALKRLRALMVFLDKIQSVRDKDRHQLRNKPPPPDVVQ